MVAAFATFVQTVNVAQCRVSNTPKLIFLCGGKVRAEATAPTTPYRSARDYFYLHTKEDHPALSARIALAETLNEWFDNTFADLLELEEYLADLSDLIIVFVESPGSIAELGAFAAPIALGPKVLAVMNLTHDTSHTFIADGPVRRIKSHDGELVRYFHWTSEALEKPAVSPTLEDMRQDITQFLLARATAAPKEQRLDLTSHGHRILLLADIVEVLGMASEADLAECMSLFDGSLQRTQLRKYLSILRRLKFIVSWPYSNQEYYVSSAATRDRGFIRYDFVAGTKLRDRDRLKTAVRGEMAAHNGRWGRAFRAFSSHQDKSEVIYA